MIFIWGFRLFGKVDEVPGVFHVASKFFHIWYIPLFPIGSHLVLGRTKAGTIGKSVPLRLKSAILAWLRALCILGMLYFGWQSVLELMNVNRPIPHHGSYTQTPAASPAGPANPVGVPSGMPSHYAPANSAPQAVSDRAIHIILAAVLLTITAAFLLAAVLLWKLKWLRRASYKRAMHLCEHARLSDEARIMIERHFGRISDADAQAALAALAADREEMERLAAEENAAVEPA